jgi:hypothetical protein
MLKPEPISSFPTYASPQRRESGWVLSTTSQVYFAPSYARLCGDPKGRDPLQAHFVAVARLVYVKYTAAIAV